MGRSSASLAKLTIEWGKLAKPSAALTGVRTSEIADMSNVRGALDPSLRQYDRPILVYLESQRCESKTDRETLETTTLKDERVALSARLFTTVKGNADEMSSTHPYAKFFSDSTRPRFLVYSSKGELVGKLEGRVSPSKLYELMKRAVTGEYAVTIDRWITDYQKVLTAIDKLSGLKLALDQKAESDTSTAAKREIAARRAKLQSEEDALIAEEQRLLDVSRKTTS